MPFSYDTDRYEKKKKYNTGKINCPILNSVFGMK